MSDDRKGGETRRRIVKAALALFCARGYGAVGTSDICAAAGVLKGSLYHHFSSKLEVALAALKEYGEGVRSHFVEVARSSGTAAERLSRIFEDVRHQAATDHASVGVVYGCLHGNLAMELSATEPTVRSALEEVTAGWAAAIQPIVNDLLAEGRISDASDAQARAVLAYLHGVVLMAKAANDPAVISTLGRRVLSLLAG